MADWGGIVCSSQGKMHTGTPHVQKGLLDTLRYSMVHESDNFRALQES